jgi:hypothetical protein
MKKTICSLLMLILAFANVNAQVAIGTSTPHASAKFQIDATDKGFLAPRVALTSLTDNATIASPATGLMVYCNGTGGLEEGFYYWNGSSWTKMSQVSNNQDLGYVVGWPSNATPPGYLLPLSGGTYNWADYPEFQTFNGTYASQFIASSTATTFTLKDINSTGRFLRGGSTAGTDQAGSTKLPVIPFAISTAGAHTHSVDPASVNTNTTGAHTHNTTFNITSLTIAWGVSGGGAAGYAYSGATTTTSSGDHAHTVDVPATTSTSNGDHNHTISGGDAETRPINTSIVWCIKVKPTAAAGNVSITNNITNVTSPVVSNHTYGDVKTGIQAADHDGWIKLDGRTKSSLSTDQQTRATALGIGVNLPNANNAVLMQNGQALGSVTGSNTRTIDQNQLPNVTLSHSRITSFTSNSTPGNASGSISGSGTTNVLVGWTGNGSVNLTTTNSNLTSSINGGVTQQTLDVTPKSLSINTFIYLGN